MQPDSRFLFHALVTGQGKTKFLIVTRQPADLDPLPGVRVLVEPALRPALETLLQATEGKKLAADWGVSESLVYRLRAGMGLAGTYTGDSRTTAWRRGEQAASRPATPAGAASEAAPTVETPIDLPITVVGDGQRQVVVVEATRREWDMPEAGNLLVERDDRGREQFRLWLENQTVNQAAERLGVARNIILYARHLLGVREWGKGTGHRQRRAALPPEDELSLD
jgi:hypothetical protein